MSMEPLEKIAAARQMHFLALVDASGTVLGEVGDRALAKKADPYGCYFGSAHAISETVRWIWGHELTPRAFTDGVLTVVLFKISQERAALAVIDGEPKFPFRYPEMVEVERELRATSERWRNESSR